MKMSPVLRVAVGMPFCRSLVAALALAAALAALAGEPFTVVALPDTQNYNRKPQPNLFGKQTQWIADNVAAQKIVFVTQLGDFTDDGTKEAYWANAIAGMDILNGKVPYSVCFGNHDLHWHSGGDGVAACKAYGSDKSHQGAETYGGASPDGLSFYQIFKGGDFSILHLNLKFAPDADTLAWAKEVIKGNPGKPVIISTHTNLNIDGSRDKAGEALWSGLAKDAPAVFMILNGHYHGEAKLLSSNAAEGKVAQILADYQSYPSGGDGLLRLIKFIPDQGIIEIKTYSPSMARYKEGIDSDFSYDAKFDAASNSISILKLRGFADGVEPPRISSQPADQKFAPGATAKFSVAASGTAPLAYQWKKNGKDIQGATDSSYSTGEEPSDAKGPVFSATVSNAAGSVTSRGARLSPAAPPPAQAPAQGK